tara:strand:- start:591 stop:923 length:333 start_codon:yes stop_codon:yes gene_type:complete
MADFFADTFLWIAGGFASVFALVALGGLFNSKIRWSGLILSDATEGASIPRIVYLFGTVALALMFLMSILQAGTSAERIAESFELFEGLDITALTGGGSAAYFWSKLSSK